jgi:ABC-2 type transport system permease protein
MSVSLYKSISRPALREWKQMIRRPIFFVASVGIVVFCYVFFLTFLNAGKPTELPAGVVDLDNSNISRTFIRNMDATPQTHIIRHYTSYSDARDDMQRGNIYGFMLIKKDFEKELLAYRRPGLTLYVNDAYLNAGSLLQKDMAYMSVMGSGFMQMRMMEGKGISHSQIKNLIQPLALDTHLIANPFVNYGIYLLNMILPGLLQLMVMILTIFTIGGELKDRTGRQWLKASNKSMFAALTGKMIPHTFLFTLLGIGGNLILFRFMAYTMNGSLYTMFLATFVLVISSQATGIFLIGLFPEISFSLSIGSLYGLLGVSFSGFTFPIEGMTPGIRMLSNVFPLRHYFRIYTDIALNGSDLHISLAYFAFMLAFCILPLLVLFRLKKAVIFMSYPSQKISL